MDKKYLIIIIAIIAAVAIVGGYLLYTQQEDLNTTTLVLSDSAYMKVPLSKSATSKADKDGIFYYVDKEHGLNVTTYNSNVSKSTGLSKINKLKSTMESGAKQSDEGGVIVYEKDGVYSVYVKNTGYNDTIIIQSTDKQLLLQSWKSIKYHDPSDSLKFEDSKSVVNVTEETQTAVAEASSSSSSSSNTGTTTTDTSTSDSSPYVESSYDGSSSPYVSDSGSSGSDGASPYVSSGSSGSGGSGASPYMR